MTISEDRILDVRSQLDAIKSADDRYINVFIEQHYDISPQSARRYIRLAKAYGEPEPKTPKILIIDIETAPCVGYFWRPGYKVNIPPENIIEDVYIICYAAKWLFSDGVFGDCVTPSESLVQNDKRVCTSLWNTMEEADIIIAHNGDKFDIPIINSRLIVNGFGPPSPYTTIDTLKQSWKNFKFSSNKLDELNKLFGLDRKIETKFDLWKGCKNGDKESLDYMYHYCKGDIVALEGLYLYLRPWMTSHPNLALYCDIEGEICPHCMSTQLDWEIKPYVTPAGKYRAFRCKCGAIGRSRFTALTKDERMNLTISTAR